MNFIKGFNLVFILFIMSMGSVSSLECRGGGGGGGGHMGGGGFHGGGMGGHSMSHSMSHEMGHQGGNRNYRRNRGGGGGYGYGAGAFLLGEGLLLDEAVIDGDYYDGDESGDDNVDLDDEIAGY